MGRLIRLILLFALLIVALGFALLNAESIQVDYYLGKLSVPLSLALVVVLAMGAVIGVIASLGMVLRAKRQNTKLRKQVKNTEKEVSHLRALPPKYER